MVPNFRITFTSVPVLVKWFVVSSHLKELQLTYTILIEHTFHHIHLQRPINFWAALDIIRLLQNITWSMINGFNLLTTWSAYDAKKLMMVIWTLPSLKSRKILSLLSLLFRKLDISRGVSRCRTMWHCISFPFLKSNQIPKRKQKFASHPLLQR